MNDAEIPARRPRVAIVGRPNVGKSTLFNRLVGSRLAIVEPTAGVTRDRMLVPVRIESPDLDFDLMDTGGIGIVDRVDLAEAVEYQVMTGVEDADLVLFVVDAIDGCTVLDEAATRLLRRAGRPLLLIANKCESGAAQISAAEFGKLGLGDPLRISAKEGIGAAELREAMARHLPPADQVPPVPDGSVRITVLGRRNTGKSSFVNALLGEQRVIVSEIPGTTRDAIEVRFEWEGQPITLVDTAGVHRRSKVANAIEYFSLTRSDQAIRRCDVALLFLDLTDRAARQDQELARRIHDRHKPVVVVGTKSDLDDATLAEFRDVVEHKLPHLHGAPVVRASNLTGDGLAKVMRTALELHAESGRRVGTGELNRAMVEIFSAQSFRGRGEKPRVYYATQLRVAPPTFLLFVNRAPLFEKEVLRAIANKVRAKVGYQRVPVRLVLRERERSPSKKN
ncbi:MAG TPA: ribosome biogenesis GTPase Der [Planctomycetota bacterium]